MEPEQPTNPLLDIIMGFIYSSEPSLSQESMEAIKKLVQERINGKISSQELIREYSHFCSSCQPIERLEAILSTPDEPIPAIMLDKYDSSDLARKKTRTWTSYEDQRLIAAVHRFGLDNWALVALFIGNGRTRAQCAQRWNRGLDPRISKDHWTAEEETKLIHLVLSVGNKGWTCIATGMGNRSDVQCRYHYIQMKKEGRIPNSFDETDLLPTAKSLKSLPIRNKTLLLHEHSYSTLMPASDSESKTFSHASSFDSSFDDIFFKPINISKEIGSSSPLIQPRIFGDELTLDNNFSTKEAPIITNILPPIYTEDWNRVEPTNPRSDSQTDNISKDLIVSVPSIDPTMFIVW